MPGPTDSRIEAVRARADAELQKALLGLDPDDYTDNTSNFDVFIYSVRLLFIEEAAELLRAGTDFNTFKRDLRSLAQQIVGDYTRLSTNREMTKKERRGLGCPKEPDEVVSVVTADKWDLYIPSILIPSKKNAVRRRLRMTVGEQIPFWHRQATAKFGWHRPPSPRPQRFAVKESLRHLGEADKPTMDSGFWRRLRKEFLEHATDDPGLTAQWQARFGKWALKEGAHPSPRAHPRPARRFKKTAKEGGAVLPDVGFSGGTEPWQQACVTFDTEPWERWLNRLRVPEYNCQPLGSPIAVTQAEWERMTESVKSLSEVRGEFSKIAHDEWEKQRETGKPLASLLSELGLSIDADGSKPFKWLQDAEIKHVFKESARLCADIALGVEKVEGAAERGRQQVEHDMSNSKGAANLAVPIREVPTPSLSRRDQEVHNAVGRSNFHNLTNSEIMRDANLGRKLKKEYKLQSGTDATKTCLDRIRRAKGYPLSRAITNKRSGEQ
jgi:hypothetical protein